MGNITINPLLTKFYTAYPSGSGIVSGSVYTEIYLKDVVNNTFVNDANLFAPPTGTYTSDSFLVPHGAYKIAYGSTWSGLATAKLAKWALYSGSTSIASAEYSASLTPGMYSGSGEYISVEGSCSFKLEAIL